MTRYKPERIVLSDVRVEGKQYCAPGLALEVRQIGAPGSFVLPVLYRRKASSDFP